MKRKAIAIIAAGAAAVALSLAGCTGTGSSTSSNYTVNWWTWDPNQAAAYEQCIPAFEKANPGIKVKVSQYNVADYFTKLTTTAVAGTAPDAFQDALLNNLSMLEPLDSYLAPDQLKKFALGVKSGQGPDGKQLGLPLDWASAAMYFNEKAVTDAGLTTDQIENMTWNPQDGGTFQKIVAHMTIDQNGVRGDQPGFDKTHIKQYGVGVIGANDFSGQTSWYPFAASTGWFPRDKAAWPTKFTYDEPKFVQTMDWVKSLIAAGYSPNFNQTSLSDSQLIGSGKVAMTVGGSWEATGFAALPGVKVGIAPTVKGPEGIKSLSNSNTNVMWKGSKNKKATFAWMSYQGSEACQTKAATYNGSFFPSIANSMKALVTSEQAKGVDLSVFLKQQTDKQLIDQLPAKNWNQIGTNLNPLFEAYFTGEKDNSVWPEAVKVSQDTLAGKNG
ncbi:extracellular solute-binding protein [Leifsonia sp. NPDC056665]|uniref:extracellular solute-binding protein n=1 Tax=Leifsonia sp. NPDC056665 TaxID=3345901 RepID=UPI0036AF7920